MRMVREISKLYNYKSFNHFLRAVKRYAKKLGIEDWLTAVLDDERTVWETLKQDGEVQYKISDETGTLIIEACWYGEWGTIYMFNGVR